MPATGLLALLDDISTLLEDVSTMSKVAAQKTAGIAGDDLAVNAEGLVGLEPSRELPIVGKVALGSTLNKVVLIGVALVLPHTLITPLLMLGGTFLCYEGIHKVLHRRDHEDEQHHAELLTAARQSADALQQVEATKVRQAILTDFILSAEIVAIALGTVAEEPLATKATVLAVVGLGMTVLVYGLVAAIVKVDDIGLHLQSLGRPDGFRARLGRLLVAAMPYVMKGVSVVGTAAMFLVGGGILLHGLPGVEAELHHLVEAISGSGIVQGVLGTLASLVAGVALGGVAWAMVEGVKKLLGRRGAAPASGARRG